MSLEDSVIDIKVVPYGDNCCNGTFGDEDNAVCGFYVEINNGHCSVFDFNQLNFNKQCYINR